MFFAANQYGAEILSTAYDSLPIPSAQKLSAVSKFLGISERTFTGYLSGKNDPPRAVAYSIWHESPIGHAVTSAHSAQGAALYRGLSETLRQENESKDALIFRLSQELIQAKMARAQNHSLGINDPYFRTA